MVLDYVVAGTQVVTERPPEVLRQRLDDVLSTAATLRADQAYLPRTGPWCTGCDLLKRCPEGQREVAGVTGLVMTKLDGTARGGVLVAAAEKYGIPIHAIGVGEGMDDLRPFDPALAARAISGAAA